MRWPPLLLLLLLLLPFGTHEREMVPLRLGAALVVLLATQDSAAQEANFEPRAPCLTSWSARWSERSLSALS